MRETTKFYTGALTKSEIEADPRDFKASVVLPAPTEDELKNLPEEFHNEDYIARTYNQGAYGSCTSMGTTHSMLVQNTQELILDNEEIRSEIANRIRDGKNAIELERKDLWKKMGHDLNNTKDSGDYAENALKTAIKLGIVGTDFFGNPIVLFGSNYADSGDYSEQMIKYRIKNYGVGLVISGNQNTWREMSKGEVKTVISKSASTGGHYIYCSGYDSYGIIVVNSWTPNDSKKRKSMFKISRANVAEMAKTGMLNWRYWVLFDKKDAVFDLDLYREENKAIEILKLLTTFYGETHYKDVQTTVGALGATIRKNYPRANKEVPKK